MVGIFGARTLTPEMQQCDGKNIFVPLTHSQDLQRPDPGPGTKTSNKKKLTIDKGGTTSTRESYSVTKGQKEGNEEMSRTLPNIIITGTPGTGKTSHSELLAERTGLKHISINDVVKDRECHEGWDDEYQSWIVDEDKVRILYSPPFPFPL
jgi:hypothetical protein